jgi:hypothetical protein
LAITGIASLAARRGVDGTPSPVTKALAGVMLEGIDFRENRFKAIESTRDP